MKINTAAFESGTSFIPVALDITKENLPYPLIQLLENENLCRELNLDNEQLFILNLVTTRWNEIVDLINKSIAGENKSKYGNKEARDVPIPELAGANADESFSDTAQSYGALPFQDIFISKINIEKLPIQQYKKDLWLLHLPISLDTSNLGRVSVVKNDYFTESNIDIFVYLREDDGMIGYIAIGAFNNFNAQFEGDWNKNMIRESKDLVFKVFKQAPNNIEVFRENNPSNQNTLVSFSEDASVITETIIVDNSDKPNGIMRGLVNKYYKLSEPSEEFPFFVYIQNTANLINFSSEG